MLPSTNAYGIRYKIWERVWHPFLVFFIGMSGCLTLTLWLNIWKGRLPKNMIVPSGGRIEDECPTALQ
jgi:hypothetical protein